ncbi:beta strand repeat-containing protein [Roseicella aquatilis]|nr:calcium-binding protein [Roseicella aquatilis]
MALTTVTGTRSSALSMSGSDVLTITETGSFVGTANPLVSLGATTGAGAVIDNSGTLQTTGARAIRLTATGSSLELTNRAGAAITSQGDVINVQQNNATGTLVVSNDGTISSTGVNSNNGQAIDFNNVTAGSVTVTNHATGVLRAADSDAVRPGNGATIHNYGLIDGRNYQTNSGADGIDFQDNASGTVHNNAGATITGGRHGINHSEVEGNTAASVSLTNWGTVEGRNGSGFGSDNAGVVENHGLIVGRVDSIAGVANGDGDGVDIDHIGTVRNWGTIEGAGAKGVGSDGLPNTSQGVAIGGGTVENHAGAQIISLGDGILVDNSSAGAAFAATTIGNEGLIRGDAGHGIRLVGTWADTLTNAGTIQGGNRTAVDMGGGDDRVVLTGGQLLGLLDGGAGADTLDLSAETAALAVDLGAGSVAGTGWLSSIAQVEAVLTGSGRDTLAGGTGGDTLDGGAGADSMAGGAGDDTYVVEDAGDRVAELAGGGTDTVRAGVNHILRGEVENLVLTGAARLGAGNALDNHLQASDLGVLLRGLEGSDTLAGGAGDDALNGGSGADSMAGGAGNDAYVVDDVADLVTETAGQGNDLVQAFIDCTLGAELERLQLMGSGDLSGTGNALDNLLRGNTGGNLLLGLAGADAINGLEGDDTVAGGAGADTLTGGAGRDLFLFGDATEGRDRIMDFTSGLDQIGLSAAGFGIDSLVLSQGAAQGKAAQLVYVQATGALLWDADGTGSGAAAVLATLAARPALTAADVVLA